MGHKGIALILATGGPGMVKAAYSSGTPAIGVGSGNTPVIIDERADIRMAVNSILLSKTFDNGMICASEQSVVCLDEVYDKCARNFCGAARGLPTKNRQRPSAGSFSKTGRSIPPSSASPHTKSRPWPASPCPSPSRCSSPNAMSPPGRSLWPRKAFPGPRHVPRARLHRGP